MRSRLWQLFIINVSLSFFTPLALEITSSSVSPVYARPSDSVTLSCHFTLSYRDVERIDIEWNLKPSDIQAEEKTVIWYTADRIHDNYEPLKSRIHFVSRDPASGNASVVIRDLKVSDSGTYQCKIRKLPGYSSIVIRLAVVERPSELTCHLEGEVKLNNEVVLICNHKHSSLPIWYTWTKPNGYAAFSKNPMSGHLFLTISTEDALGHYSCTSHSFFGTEKCNLTVSFVSSMKSAVIPTVASVSVLLLMISITVISICLKRKRKPVVEDVGNEIVEDALPPSQTFLQTQF